MGGRGTTLEQRQYIRELVGEIENLRRARQAHWRELPHPEGKRFTQDELEQLAYGSYKNLLVGRTLRLPTRADLLQIAAYLECTIHETNDLLLAAQYLPEQVELPDDQLLAALEQARALIASLPLPAYVVSREWEMVAANQHYHCAYFLPDLATLPADQRTVVHLTFDPTSPLRALGNPDPATRAQNCRRLLRLFRRPGIWQREPWYRATMESFRVFPEFNALWPTIDDELDPDPFRFDFIHPQGQRFSVRGFVADVTPYRPPLAPRVVIAQPIDAVALAHYVESGCPIEENRWEYLLEERTVR